MKKITYILLFLLTCSSILVAQEKKEITGEKKDFTVAEPLKPWDDPKISDADRQQMMMAESVNPVKITETLPPDPKMDPSQIPSESSFVPIMKPEPIPELEARELIIDPKSTISVNTVDPKNLQPEAGKKGEIIDYRTMNGPQTQAKGVKADKVTEYSRMNGENTQPEAKPSGK